jgi:hypothetical protein
MARQRITSQGRLWSKHDRGWWEGQALNPKIPLVTRVYALAYGMHGANGHAPFRPGELRRILVQPPTADHPIKLYDRATLYRAIETAKDYGFLDRRSSSQCLIVPQGQIQFGIGELYAPCEVCTKRVGRASGLVATPIGEGT